jgi:hypothetical protein
MRIITFESKELWLRDRERKVTGTGLKDIVHVGGPSKDDIVKELGELAIEFDKKLKKEDLQALLPLASMTKLMLAMDKKMGYYQLIADRLTVSEEEFEGYVPNETPMDRGTRLQARAVEVFEGATGKKVDQSLVMWCRDDNESIAISPDGQVIGEHGALETKCLSSAKHVKAYLEKEIPDEYLFQRLQYFIVNDDLQTLYFAFYDPRMPTIEFFFIEVRREDVQAEIDQYLDIQRKTLAQVDAVVAELTGF